MTEHKRTNRERLTVIEEVVLRLETRLFGNGQPGEIAAIKTRVGRLERWVWRGIGAIAGLALFAELAFHIKHIL